MRSLQSSVVLSLLFWAATVAVLSGQGTSGSPDLASFKTAWREYREDILDSGGHMTISEHVEVNGEKETASAELKYHPSFGALVFDDLSDGRRAVRCTNPTYSFEVSGADETWSIASLYGDAQDVPRSISVLEEACISNFVAGLDLGDIAIDEITADTSHCEVIGIVESPINDVPLFCLTLRYTPEGKEDTCPIRTASCWINPARRYLLEKVEAEREYTNGVRLSRVTTFIYDNDTNLPRATRVSLTENGDSYSMKGDYLYEALSGSPAANEFTLSAFGLPEPTDVRTKSIRLWILLITAVLIAALSYRNYRTRRLA